MTILTKKTSSFLIEKTTKVNMTSNNYDYREREREREREQNQQTKKESNYQLVPFLLEAQEDEDNELFTQIWNLREEISSLAQIDQISQQELLTKGLELYQKDRKKRKFLISQIQQNILSQLGNK